MKRYLPGVRPFNTSAKAQHARTVCCRTTAGARSHLRCPAAGPSTSATAQHAYHTAAPANCHSSIDACVQTPRQSPNKGVTCSTGRNRHNTHKHACLVNPTPQIEQCVNAKASWPLSLASLASLVPTLHCLVAAAGSTHPSGPLSFLPLNSAKI